MPATPSIFDAMFQAADPILDGAFAQAVVYRRGTSSLAITATKQFHEVEAATHDGLVESWIGYAFEINTDVLAISGTAFTPAIGDEIAEALTEVGYQVYAVLPLPDSRCYAPSDTDGTKTMVYAKAIRKESA